MLIVPADLVDVQRLWPANFPLILFPVPDLKASESGTGKRIGIGIGKVRNRTR